MRLQAVPEAGLCATSGLGALAQGYPFGRPKAAATMNEDRMMAVEPTAVVTLQDQWDRSPHCGSRRRISVVRIRNTCDLVQSGADKFQLGCTGQLFDGCFPLQRFGT